MMNEVNIINNEINIMYNGNLIKVDDIIKNRNIENELKEIIGNLEKNWNIEELYSFNDLKLYSFYRSTLCNNIKEFLKAFSTIEAIINEFGDNIIINTDNIEFYRIATEIFNVKCYKVDSKSVKSSKYSLKNILRILKGFISFIKIYLKRNKENILAITQAADISQITINNEIKYYDVQYGKVLEELSKNTNVIKLQLLNNNDIIKKASFLGNEFIPYECFLILKRILRKKFSKYNNKIENQLYKLESYKLEISKSHNVSEFFYKEYLKNLESIYINYAIEIETASYFGKKLNINKLIATNEADRARCFIVGANKLGVPTFGIQHGIISDVSYAYFTPTNQKILVPTMTFLWGKSFQDILLKTNVYSLYNTKVVGQSRTDFLIEKANLSNINRSNTKKILYATQPIDDLTYEATNILFESIKGLDNIEILIKLHPNDPNKEYYYSMIKKYNYDNIRVEKEIDLYDAIIWCDLIFTVHSTVVLDGAILRKPSVCCLLKNYYDQGDFVKNNISYGINTSNELRKVLVNNDLEIDYDIIDNNIFSPDGNVYIRIINTINSI